MKSKWVRCRGYLVKEVVFFLINAVSLPLLARCHCGTVSKSMYVVPLNPLVYNRDFLHCLFSLQLKFLVIEIDQLVAEPVHIPSKASLARHNIFVIVDILVEEVPVLELVLRVIVRQLLICEGLADRVWLVRFKRLIY